jgi:hypothetical protein
MKRLWVAAALAPLSFAAAARAQDMINNGISKPVATATANNGQPEDIVIGAGGSVQTKVSGAAVTLNSNNSVTNNGSITFNNTNNAVGIQGGVAGQPGFTGTAGVAIDNEGAISLSESATQKINGTNGIAEGIFVNGVEVGNFAQGTDRFGIQIVGTTPLIGSLTNNGSITVVGENSAGIDIGSAGLTGNLNLGTTGTVTITGDNGFGIHSAGVINGNVTISGALTATGAGTTGLALDQGATGNVDIAAAVTVTGFHSVTPPFTVNQINSLQPSQLTAGGPAVTIGGSVGGGISIDAPVAAVAATSTAPAVVATTGGSITATGSTALLIGGAGPGTATIGAASNGLSLNVGGTITSSGVYQNFNATGIQIGTGAGGVVMAGGIDVGGAINANTVATTSTADSGSGSGQTFGIHVLSGAALNGNVTVTGSISASSTSTVNNTVTALGIESGVTGSTILTNSGTIAASITGIAAVIGGQQQAAGGNTGTVTAISDQSGVITGINNSGLISATITPIVPLQTESGTTTALDLRGNKVGVTVTQTMAPTILATSSTSATTPVTPAITGDVLFGAGNANLNLYAGTLTGAVAFGTGANSLDLENGATLTGAVSEPLTGGTLALTVGASSADSLQSITGTILSSTTTSTLNMTAPNHLNLSSLNIGSTGQVIFTLDPANGQASQLAVVNGGTANLAAGAKIGFNIISANTQVQTFDLITTGTTGTLTSAQPVSALLGSTPFLFNAQLSQTTGVGGSVDVTVGLKTPAQLGLNAAETAAYTAITDQLKADQDPTLTADVLSKTNRQDFIHLYDQFLPDFEGGSFDTLVVGQEQIAEAEAEAPLKLQGDEPRGWVQEIGYLNYRQDTAAANGYHAGGFGFLGGLEQAHGDSTVGVSAAFLTDGILDDRQGPGAGVSTAGVELGVYWRYGSQNDGLAMHASLNGGYMYFSNHRLLFDENNAGTVNLFREAKSQWNGGTATGEFGASYHIPIGRFYIRPEVVADYIYLYESAFNEHGGGVSEDLAVASRTSAEASVQGDVVLGEDMGGVYHWRPEVTLGYRDVFSGGPGDTTARFISGGPSFTLSPKFDDHGSLIARLGVRAGGNFADFSADAGGQYNSTYQVYDARAVARFLF